MKTDATNSCVCLLVEGLGIDDHLAMVIDGEVFAFVKDPVNTVRRLISSTANTEARYRYSAFGALRSQESTVNNPYLFAGRSLDPETNLYYFRLRHFAPSDGRFISRDYQAPKEPSYQYGLNNPLTMIDPSGGYSISSVIREHPTNSVYVGAPVSINHRIQLSKAQELARSNIERFLDRPDDSFCAPEPVPETVVQRQKQVFRIILSGLTDSTRWISYSAPNELPTDVMLFGGCIAIPYAAFPDALSSGSKRFRVSPGTILVFDKAFLSSDPLDAIVVHEAWHDTTGSNKDNFETTVEFADKLTFGDAVEAFYEQFILNTLNQFQQWSYAYFLPIWPISLYFLLVCRKRTQENLQTDSQLL